MAFLLLTSYILPPIHSLFTTTMTKQMDTQTIITLLLIGLAAGILSGLVGVGGGIVMVPALVFFLHYTQHQAQGTSLGVIMMPVVLLAFLQYYKMGQQTGNTIQWQAILTIAAAFIIGGLIGGKLAVNVNQQVLKKVFAIVLFYTAFKMMGWDKSLMSLFNKI
ncbi:sulfite exporter TauE/SafE family protein [Lacibacter sp. MH-610]|uniref:TSUP family transporter n=1 Tax=Lacibacter sp. MH-610 TaxID=3020883 RepID=UPI003891F427